MSDTKEFLQGLMTRYTTENVADPVAFEKRIREFLELDDWKMEGYPSPDGQRPRSIKFEWGHDHDFGTFKLEGAMGTRHIDVLASFVDKLGLPRDLTDKTVLDVGVWCGGTSLLLSAMKARVVTIEEVKKYYDCFDFMLDSFGMGKTIRISELRQQSIIPYNLSVYDHQGQDYYDYVIFPGVLYHLTDPILALRILFNALKDGGEIYLETMCTHDAYGRNILVYAGGNGSNWFIFEEGTLVAMMQDVGFEGIEIKHIDGRLIAYGKRVKHKEMLRAGLSRRDVR